MLSTTTYRLRTFYDTNSLSVLSRFVCKNQKRIGEMTRLKKSGNMGQIMTVIVNTEHDSAKAKILRWAVLSGITREEQGLPSVLGFYHGGDLVWPVSPEWQGTSLDRGLYQPLCCRWGRWENCCEILSHQPWDLTYTLFSDQVGSLHPVCWIPQIPAQSLYSRLIIFLYWYFCNHGEELTVLLIVWGCSLSMALNNNDDNNKNPFFPS